MSHPHHHYHELHYEAAPPVVYEVAPPLQLTRPRKTNRRWMMIFLIAALLVALISWIVLSANRPAYPYPPPY
jgi:hypothetical protein